MCSQHDFPIKLSNILSTVHLVKKCLHVKSGIEGVINLIFILMIVPSFHQGRRWGAITWVHSIVLQKSKVSTTSVVCLK